jgi:hypothetical protein
MRGWKRERVSILRISGGRSPAWCSGPSGAPGNIDTGRITATSFTNSYEWGDLKGDPADFVKRWFDLHLYLANWGRRRLMIRLPARLVDQRFLKPLMLDIDWATLQAAGDTLILDIERDEVGLDEDWDDGSGWLAALAPLRADLLAGDLRIFYLLWLAWSRAAGWAMTKSNPCQASGR